MANQTCWRCLTRILRTYPRPTPSAIFSQGASFSNSFSTSAFLSATNPPKPVKAAQKAQKGKRSLRLSKNKRGKDSYKKPDPGERKALRKRIVLSNTNALDVPGLADLSEHNYAQESSVGNVLGIPGPIVDSLRAIEAFKPSQGWAYFRKPATLWREETLEIGRHVKECEAAEQPQTMRKIITGERGVGTSVLLVQAQAMAFMKGWIVVHFPDGQEITNASNSYAPLPDAKPPKYVQNAYTASLLGRVAKANEPTLSNLSTLLTHDLPVPIQSNISLTRLAELGAQDPNLAWPVFQALWRELTVTPAQQDQGKGKPQSRPPLLLSLDGLAHITRPSEYLTPSMHFIHGYDLVLIEHFIAYLSGSSPLPNGGMVLAVDSHANRPSAPSLDLAMRQSEAQALASKETNPFLLAAPGTSTTGPASTSPLYDPMNPYAAADPIVVRSLNSVPVTRLAGFSRPHAKTLLEYYAHSGMLRASVTDRLVAEKWMLSGGGVVGELERGTVRAGL